MVSYCPRQVEKTCAASRWLGGNGAAVDRSPPLGPRAGGEA